MKMTENLVGKRSPWGVVDFAREVAPGIILVNTPGHGGYKLDRLANSKVDAHWRRRGGWYEEDCDWAIVAITFASKFPAVWDEDSLAAAHSTMKDGDPDTYQAVTGVVLTLEDSRELRRRKFQEDSPRLYDVLAAWGDWHPDVPAGFVAVCAKVGGRGADTLQSYFLVPKAEYVQGEFGFVFAPGVYPEHAEFRPSAVSQL
jgi:hypothetical protein